MICVCVFLLFVVCIVFFVFFFVIWIVFFLGAFCDMNCVFLWYELLFFLLFCVVWIVSFLLFGGMNCVFFVFFWWCECFFCVFLVFFCGMNCVSFCVFLRYVWLVFFWCFFCGMNCVFFCAFFCTRERRTSTKKHKRSTRKSAFLWKKWSSGRLTSTAFGPAAQQMCHTISFFQPPFQKNLSGVSPCQERECEKM